MLCLWSAANIGPSMPTTTTTMLLVRPLIHSDIDALAPILRQHIRDLHSGEIVESEVAAVMACMAGAPDASGRQRTYLVACASHQADQPLACMAWAAPDALMMQHFAAAGSTQEQLRTSVELLNAFVTSSRLGGQGVGRTLLAALCQQAIAAGATQLLVNSGPRYRHSWGFYDRVCDSSHGFIDNFYGPGRHAKTWKKVL
jgi:hypothetical protein